MQQQAFTVSAVLDQCRAAAGLRSDYALSKRLNCPTQTVSNWRAGRSLPDEKKCIQLAEIGGFDADYLAVKFNALRAQNDEARALWNRIAARLAAGVHVFLACFLFATNYIATDAHAALLSGHPPAETIQHDLPYVKRLYHILDAIFPMGLLAAILWLLAHDSGAFTPCFVPQK